MSNTSMTSTSGVVLMSDIGEPSSAGPALMAMERSCPTSNFAGANAGRTTLRFRCGTHGVPHRADGYALVAVAAGLAATGAAGLAAISDGFTAPPEIM
ncbi:hypothetical protein ACFB49_48910 [Sphingomonas sp. DBB INV C78]